VYCFRVAFVIFASLSLLEQLAKRDVFRGQGQYIRPVAQKAGIQKRVGWHTFRHSFGTLLKANGEDIKTVQELLRHANSRITLEVYTQAVTSNKRAAQSKVVKMMVPNSGAIRVQTPA
jgi:site-specific recombinase XerD